jgi:hypothetical protein
VAEVKDMAGLSGGLSENSASLALDLVARGE